MTPEIARFLIDLLARQQLQVGAADFEEVVDMVIRARKALQEIIDGE